MNASPYRERPSLPPAEPPPPDLLPWWDVTATLALLWVAAAARVGWVIGHHQQVTTEVLLAELVVFVAPVLAYKEVSARRRA
jgi:hypothetical protein